MVHLKSNVFAFINVLCIKGKPEKINVFCLLCDKYCRDMGMHVFYGMTDTCT